MRCSYSRAVISFVTIRDPNEREYWSMKGKVLFLVFFFAGQSAFAAELRVPGPAAGPPVDRIGTGLDASFFAARDVVDNNEALKVASESAPSASFLARLIDYGNGE